MIGLGTTMQMMNNATPPSIDGKYQLACTNGYLYVSTDFGSTFTPRGTSMDWRASAINNDGTIMFAAAYGNYIYKSTDYGVSWTALTGLGTNNWDGVAASDDGVYILAGVYNSVTRLSTNGGLSGAAISNYMTLEARGAVAVSSTGQFMTFGGSWGGANMYIYKSNDYGATWAVPQNVWPLSIYSVAMSRNGQYQYITGEGIPKRSTDFGATFLDTWGSGGRYQVSMSGNGVYGLVGSMSTSRILRSTNYCDTFATVSGSLSVQWYLNAISYTGKYMLAQRNGYYLYRSANYGVNWTAVNTTVRNYVGLSINNYNG